MSASGSPMATAMTSPVKQNECVYYQVQVYEFSGSGKQKQWIHRFTETQWEDFILYDPDYPQHRLLIPSRKTVIRVRSMIDGRAASGNGSVAFFQSETLPDGISRLLSRHNFQVETNLFFVKKKKKMKYLEESFDIGEQIACLGIVRDGVDAIGSPIKVMHPLHEGGLEHIYFPNDCRARMIWSDLTGSGPTILASDDPIVFQGLKVRPGRPSPTQQFSSPPMPPSAPLQYQPMHIEQQHFQMSHQHPQSQLQQQPPPYATSRYLEEDVVEAHQISPPEAVIVSVQLPGQPTPIYPTNPNYHPSPPPQPPPPPYSPS